MSRKGPDGLNPALYKVFEKYRLGDRAMLCLWYNGQVNTGRFQDTRITRQVKGMVGAELTA